MSTLNWGDLIKEAGESGNYDPLPDGDYDVLELGTPPVNNPVTVTIL